MWCFEKMIDVREGCLAIPPIEIGGFKMIDVSRSSSKINPSLRLPSPEKEGFIYKNDISFV